MIDISFVKKMFNEYVEKFDLKNEKIISRKNHILRVAERSKNLAINLKLNNEEIALAETIGILHDIGRFEQIKKYNTFSDKDSVNHGEYGVKILFEDRLIDMFKIDSKYHNVIYKAVINHNRNSIEKGLNDFELTQCKIIRDCDKIDIFYELINENTENTYECANMGNETFSDEIIREFIEDKKINYKMIKTPGDIFIVHMSYVYDFNFKESYEILKQTDYINKLYNKLNFKNDDTIRKATLVKNIANRYIEDELYSKNYD